MTRAIVRVMSDEERALAAAMLELEARRTCAASLQAEQATLTQTLERFAGECHLRFSALFAELDHLRRAVALCERKIARLRGQPRSRPLDDVDPEPEPEPDEDDPQWTAGPRGGRFERSGSTRPAREDPATTAELRRLYLELARRHHPDLATDEAERERRQELMLRVNAAFRARDVAALRALASEAEAADGPPLRSAGERLAWVRREIARLDRVIEDLRLELIDLRLGESGRLWTRAEAGKPVVDELGEDLKREVASQKLRLGDLTAIQERLERLGKAARRRAARTA